MKNKFRPHIKNFKRNTLALSIAAALPMSVAYAQEIKELPTAQAYAQEEDSYKVDKSSSHKYSKSLLETPKTITIISESVIKDRGITSLKDSLRGVSGISMAAGEGGDPTGDSLSIRGFSARTDIFVDGIRDISGYSRDVYNTENIEVNKGPGSSVTGRGSVGGSINMVTKAARLDTFTDVSGLMGSEKNYRITVDKNTIIGDNTALRVNAITTDGEVAGRNEVENAMDAVALSIATGLGTESRFTLSAEYQSHDRMPDYGIPWVPNYSDRTDREIVPALQQYSGGPAPVSFDNFYGNVHRDFEDIDTTSITGLYELDLSNTSTLLAQARIGSVKRKSIVTAPRFVYQTIAGVRVYGANGIAMGGEKSREQKNSITALQIAYIASVGRHDFSIGAEYSIEKEKRWILSDNGTDNLQTLSHDLYNPDPFAAYSGTYTRTGRVDTGESKTLAFYAFDSITLNDTLTLSAGLRFENYASETITIPRGQTDHVSLKRDDDMLSWNIGLVHKLQENATVYFSVGKSFNPSAEDLTARSSGNEIELDPEESLGFEIGTKWELYDNRLLASAAFFRTVKSNARSDDPLDGGSGNSRADILDGEQVVQGIELSAFGQITPEIAVTASYTYQDSEVTKATGDDAVQIGHALRRTPEHSLGTWVSYSPNSKLTTGLGFQYVGERYNSSSPGGRELAPDYKLFNAMVSYQIDKLLSVQFNGNNLTDERYIDLVGGGHFVPGPGRNFNISASYSF